MRLLTFFLLCIVVASPAHAQLQISEEEKAIFAFFKLAERVPDYTGWISHSPEYAGMPSDLSTKYFEEHETRLKWGFGTFDHTTDFLKISTTAEIFMTEENAQHNLHFRFPDSGQTEYPYFPYPYREDWIAVFIKDLQKFVSLPLKNSQAQEIKKYLQNASDQRVTMYMRVRPLSADTKSPLTINGTPFWMMSADIAYLAFKAPAANGAMRELLSYTAPWYLSETEQELLDLLQ